MKRLSRMPALLRVVLVSVLAAMLAIVSAPTVVHAVPDPYPWAKARDFTWENGPTFTAQSAGPNQATLDFLATQGIACAAGVCRATGQPPIPEVLDLSGRDLRGLTFQDIPFQNLKTNNTNLSNTTFENFRMSGKWDAVELLANGMAIRGPEGKLAPLNLNWRQVVAEGMQASRVRLDETVLDRVKAQGSTISESEISNLAVRELLTSAVKQLPRNVLVENSVAGPDGKPLEGVLPAGRYEDLNLEGTHLNGNLKNVEIANSNLKGLEVNAPGRPGVPGSKAVENLTLKNNEMEGAKFNLRNADNIKLTVQRQNNIEFNAQEGIANLRASGVATNLRLVGSYENTNLRSLRSPEIVQYENLLNLQHLIDSNALRTGKPATTFVDLSGSKQKNFQAPKNLSGSKLEDTEFTNTKLPDGLIANHVEAVGTKLRADAGNTIGKQTDFGQSQLRNVDLTDQLLEDPNFTGSIVESVRFDNARLTGKAIFDRARVVNLEATNAEIAGRGQLSALGTVWSAIKRFFGFGQQATADWGRATLEGSIDLSGMPTASLGKINWSGVSFAPNAEIVFSDPKTVVEALPKILGQLNTSTLRNVNFSAMHNGEKITIIRNGQTIDGIANRLMDLHVSGTVAENLTKQADAALRVTESAVRGIADAEVRVQQAQEKVNERSNDPRFSTLEKAWNTANLDYEIAQRKYDEYVSRKNNEVESYRRFLEQTAPDRIKELQTERAALKTEIDGLAKQVADGRKDLEGTLKQRKLVADATDRTISKLQRESESERYKYQELLGEKADGWPSDLKTQAERLAKALDRSERKLERYSKTYNSNLEKARTALANEQNKLQQARETHQRATENADFLNDTKQMAQNSHDKELVSDQKKADEILQNAEETYEVARAEADKQLAELKPQLDTAKQELDRAKATNEKAQKAYEQAPKVKDAAELKAEHDGLLAEIRKDTTAIENLKARINQVHEAAQGNISDLTTKIQARNQLLQDGSTSDDPATERRVNATLKDLEGQLRRAVQDVEYRTQPWRDQIDAANKRIAENQKKAQTAAEKIQDNDAKSKRVETLKESLAYSEYSYKEATNRLQELQAKQDALQKQIETITTSREQGVPIPKENALMKASEQRARQEEKDRKEQEEHLKRGDRTTKENLINRTKELERQQRQQEELRRQQQEQERQREAERQRLQREAEQLQREQQLARERGGAKR